MGGKREEPPRDEENDLGDTSDRELVDLCSQRSRAAWKELYRRFTPLIRKIAGRRGMKSPYVEDVVQDTFMGLAEMVSKETFDHGRGTPSLLVGNIASNKCVDCYNKINRMRFENDCELIEEIPAEAGSSPERPDHLVEKWEMTLHLRAALKNLAGAGERCPVT